MDKIDFLLESPVCRIETPFDLSAHSTIGCGGLAKAAFYPETPMQLQTIVQCLREREIPFYVVGNMSNVLPSEGISQRVFIVTRRLKTVEEENVFFGAGVMVGGLLKTLKKMGKSGAEFLAGIPCTLGGTLYMNAGAAGVYISEIVESVTVLRNGKVVVLPLSECGYAYKTSIFMQNDDVIVGAKLRLVASDKEKIEKEIERYANRRVHLPKGKSMGCVFKNPEGESAGKLIEGTGLKGMRVGGAKVSEQHANFILNDNHATPGQIKTLIEIIKNAVFAQYKIRLQEEIQYLD